MAKVYTCDACEVTIKDPYKVKMKEFYIGLEFDIGHAYPAPLRERKKVHLCEECYKGLQIIARRAKKEEAN